MYERGIATFDFESCSGGNYHSQLLHQITRIQGLLENLSCGGQSKYKYYLTAGMKKQRWISFSLSLRVPASRVRDHFP
jgi:hypothetical protein